MNVTPPVVAAIIETQTEILARKDKQSWRALGHSLGIRHSSLYALASGNWEHVGWETLTKIRCALGLPDLGEITAILPCPDCGSIHTGRCHGKHGVVVILETNERIVRQSQPRRALRKTVHLSPDAWNRLNAARQDAGATWEDFLAALLRFWTIS